MPSERLLQLIIRNALFAFREIANLGVVMEAGLQKGGSNSRPQETIEGIDGYRYVISWVAL